MPACPRCARSAAVSSPRCLYCGAPLPLDPSPPQTPAVTPPPPRTLVIVDAQGAPPGALAGALGLSSLEATRRSERGGLYLLRAMAMADAREEAARLGAGGIRTWLVDEVDVREAARPRLVRGGRHAGDALALQVDGTAVEVRPTDLLLVVRGPIHREYQSTPTRRRVHAATLEGGHRVHLHLLAPGPPLELDPGDFEFTDAADAFAPSLLAVSGWVEALQARAPMDDEFRRLPPALGAAAPAGGALAMVEALRPARTSDGPLVLDNLAQFRFYSAWRGLVERQRRR
jgi:hypothetical protein